MITVNNDIKSSRDNLGNLSVTVDEKKVISQRLDSYLSIVWKFIYHAMKDDSVTMNLLNISGSSESVASSYGWDGTGAAGSYQGVMVGSGNTAVALDDNDLATRILHGTAAGELEYGTNMFLRSASGGSNYLEVSRTFSNNSGGDVTIREVGLSILTYTSNKGPFLLVRDVLGTPITVSNGSNVTIQYNLKVSEGVNNWRGELLFPIDGNNFTINELSGTVNVDDLLFASIRADQNIGKGIMVGSGSTAKAPSDTDLASRILPGSSAGQLNYSSCVLDSLDIDLAAGTISFDITRTITNNSGAVISINEIGLFGSNDPSVDADTSVHLMFREILPSTVDLADGESEPITWRFNYSL